jgi:membrane fusion protein, multidrug efflux system
MPSPRRLPSVLVAVLAALSLSACNGEPGPDGMPPTMVSTITLAPEAASVVNELPGRLSATRVAEVRARVPGIVLERVFTEGSEVEAGELLFRIDPAPLRAEAAAAQAALARAEADAFQASALARRYAPLIAENAVSQQEYDGAVAADRQAQAAVASARAALDQARISLGYADVKAPIAGRVGRALVTEGALVGQGDATPLARIQQLDPMYADFTQSTAELSRLQRAFESGDMARVDGSSARVELLMEDGSVYGHPGRLLFSDISVDPGTGQVSLRGEFPNPDGRLLPGSYVRVRLEQGASSHALLVPKQAVQRNAGGQTFVSVVETRRDEDGETVIGPHGAPEQTAAQRIVLLGTSLGNRWLVEDGLEPGDEVIVEGFQRASPGMPVVAQPWQGGRPAPAPGEAPQALQPGMDPDAAADVAEGDDDQP